MKIIWEWHPLLGTFVGAVVDQAEVDLATTFGQRGRPAWFSVIPLGDDEDGKNGDGDERVHRSWWGSNINALASAVILTKPWNGRRAIRTTTGRALRVGRWSAPKPRRGGRRGRSWKKVEVNSPTIEAEAIWLSRWQIGRLLGEGPRIHERNLNPVKYEGRPEHCWEQVEDEARKMSSAVAKTSKYTYRSGGGAGVADVSIEYSADLSALTRLEVGPAKKCLRYVLR